MAKKKAFVRYAKNKIVAGSLILSDEAPKVGVWKEVPADLCCETPVQPCDCECNNTVLVDPTAYSFQNSCRSYTLTNDPLNQDPILVTYINCDGEEIVQELAANGGPGSSIVVCALLITQYESSMSAICNGPCIL